MTELHIILLSLGGFLVSGAWAISVFREWRYRQKARQAFSFKQVDVLMNQAKHSVRDVSEELLMHPKLSSQTNDIHKEQHPDAYAHHSVNSSVSIAAKMTELEQKKSPKEQRHLPKQDEQALVQALLDPKIDFIADIKFREPVVFESLPHIDIPRRYQILACNSQNIYSLGIPLKEPLKSLRIGMQMVDRSGVMTAHELQKFCHFASDFSERYDALCSFPQRDMKLADAQRLDRFCVDVDILITLHIVSDHPTDFSIVEAFALQRGMVLQPDGYFHEKSDYGQTLYTLGTGGGRPFAQKQTASFHHTLMFDVPRSVGGLVVFDRLRTFAEDFARHTDSKIMDEAGQELSREGFSMIRSQLDQVYACMDREHILPGSITALRLFA
jgi:hypothetical protein